MTKLGWEALAQSAAAATAVDILSRREEFNADSEIENLLWAAIERAFKIEAEHINLVHSYRDDAEQVFASPAWNKYVLERQVPIKKWRADFVLSVPDWDPIPNEVIVYKGWIKLVIECDGHEFHERTKEQAARDRSRDREMQLLGYEVFRFTGAEIWRDPWGCVRQILRWAASRS